MNKKLRKKPKYWLKREVAYLIKEWENKETVSELATDLKTTRSRVHSLTRRLRALGFNLPKKSRASYITRMIAELYAED